MVYHDEFAVSITKIGSAFVFVYSSNIDSANIYTNNAFMYIYYVSMQSITWLISSNDASNTISVLPSTFGFLRCSSFCDNGIGIGICISRQLPRANHCYLSNATNHVWMSAWPWKLGRTCSLPIWHCWLVRELFPRTRIRDKIWVWWNIKVFRRN